MQQNEPMLNLYVHNTKYWCNVLAPSGRWVVAYGGLGKTPSVGMVDNDASKQKMRKGYNFRGKLTVSEVETVVGIRPGQMESRMRKIKELYAEFSIGQPASNSEVAEPPPVIPEISSQSQTYTW